MLKQVQHDIRIKSLLPIPKLIMKHRPDGGAGVQRQKEII
jgi:hypothetical protein